jgi:hypothetical protein
VAKVTTGQIYWGAVPFVIIQLIMVAIVIAFPQLVSGGLTKEETIDADKAFQELRMKEDEEAGLSSEPADPASEPQADGSSDPDDPMRAMEEALKEEEKKK